MVAEGWGRLPSVLLRTQQTKLIMTYQKKREPNRPWSLLGQRKTESWFWCPLPPKGWCLGTLLWQKHLLVAPSWGSHAAFSLFNTLSFHPVWVCLTGNAFGPHFPVASWDTGALASTILSLLSLMLLSVTWLNVSPRIFKFLKGSQSSSNTLCHYRAMSTEDSWGGGVTGEAVREHSV